MIISLYNMLVFSLIDFILTGQFSIILFLWFWATSIAIMNSGYKDKDLKNEDNQNEQGEESVENEEVSGSNTCVNKQINVVAVDKNKNLSIEKAKDEIVIKKK